MSDFLVWIRETSIPTLLGVAGVAFIALGSIGAFKGQTLDKLGRLSAIVAGFAALFIGIYLYVRPPHSEVSQLIKMSTDYFEKWKGCDKNGIISCCHFGDKEQGKMLCFLDSPNATKDEARRMLDAHPVMTSRGATQDLDAVTIGCNFEESAPGKQYLIQIAYTYLLSATPDRKHGARRQTLKWNNLGGTWKITEVSDADFPMACKSE